MKKMMTAMAAMTLAMGLAACAEEGTETSAVTSESGSLAGTWKLDPASAQFENATSSYVIADGEYTCESCDPRYSVAADGEWQSVDRPGIDGVKFAVVDDLTVTSASRMGEEQLGESTWTVSEDGQTMTVNWTSMGGDEVVEGSTMYERVAAGPDGAHAASGEWKTVGVGEMSDAGLMVTYEIDGDTVTYKGNGSGYTATLGGDPVPVEGDNADGMIKIEKTGENTYRETYMRDGEAEQTLDLTIEGDTVSAVSTDLSDDSVVRWTATRQS